MPLPDSFDDLSAVEISQVFPDGTRVVHERLGAGVVDGEEQYLQVPVRFADGRVVYCYPKYLRPAA